MFTHSNIRLRWAGGCGAVGAVGNEADRSSVLTRSPCAGSHLFRKAVLGPVFPLNSTPGKCKGSWVFKVDERSWRAEATVCSDRDLPPWRLGRGRAFASLEKEKRNN